MPRLPGQDASSAAPAPPPRRPRAGGVRAFPSPRYHPRNKRGQRAVTSCPALGRARALHANPPSTRDRHASAARGSRIPALTETAAVCADNLRMCREPVLGEFRSRCTCMQRSKVCYSRASIPLTLMCTVRMYATLLGICNLYDASSRR